MRTDALLARVGLSERAEHYPASAVGRTSSSAWRWRAPSRSQTALARGTNQRAISTRGRARACSNCCSNCAASTARPWWSSRTTCTSQRVSIARCGSARGAWPRTAPHELRAVLTPVATRAARRAGAAFLLHVVRGARRFGNRLGRGAGREHRVRHPRALAAAARRGSLGGSANAAARAARAASSRPRRPRAAGDRAVHFAEHGALAFGREPARRHQGCGSRERFLSAGRRARAEPSSRSPCGSWALSLRSRGW